MLPKFLTIAATVLCVFAGIFSAPALSFEDVDPIFEDKEILKVSLTAPIATIMDERSVTDEVAGRFSFTSLEGDAVEVDVAVRSRGMYRRRADICEFAPLRLNFKKSQTKNTLFHKQDKVKIVTHCKNDSDRYMQTVVTEFLAYEILNLITPLSFQTRLLQIEYTDTENPNFNYESYAILIEHKDRLAKRIGEPELIIKSVQTTDLRFDHMNLVSLFEFFIGNTDFSPLLGPEGEDCCHNFVLFGAVGANLYSVPYDFDQSGIVRAPHAQANPDFGIRSVTQRVYRGRCINNTQLPASIARFQERRDAVFALVNDQVGLDDRTRKRVVKFVEDFYKIIDKPKTVQSRLIKKCI
jgi:hypothetical protein